MRTAFDGKQYDSDCVGASETNSLKTYFSYPKCLVTP